MQENWMPASAHRPQKGRIDGDLLQRHATLLEKRVSRFVTHLREIANNSSYQRHRGILKARLREIAGLRDSLDAIEEELKIALEDK